MSHQRKMAGLVGADRKATVNHITTVVRREASQKEAEGIHQTRPQQVPLLSAKNRNRRQQRTRAQQNTTGEDWKI